MKMNVWVSVLAAAFAGCQQVDECASAIEPMQPVSCEIMSPRECAKVSGEAKVWDFTKGVPSGGALRKGARLGADGMYATDATNIALAAGFALDRLWTPSGAFLFEAEFAPGRLGCSTTQTHEGILWDDLAITYVPKQTHRGFQLTLHGRRGMWTPILYAGFSNCTVNVRGPEVRLTPGKLANISFFFGANGRVVWDFNGTRSETALAVTGPLAPALRYKPVIGDRATSNYHPIDGYVRRVAITPCASERMNLIIDGRKAFVRGEDGATVAVRVLNASGTAVSGVKVEAEQFVETGRARREALDVGDLAGGAETACVFRVETRLRPGWNALRVTVTGRDAAGGEVKEVRVFRIGVGPRHADRMMALMWGYAAPEATLADYGFTHGLKYLGPGDINAGTSYDDAIVAGVGLYHSMRTVYPDDDKPDPKYMRVNRDGTMPSHGSWAGKKKGVPEVSNPAFMEAMKPLIEMDGRMYGDHPGFCGVLAISEARDGTKPSFNTEHRRYKAETGRDVPPEVDGKTLNWRTDLPKMKERFPDGVVPADDPVLAYYRWFWKGGDGWPGYSGGIAQEYHRHIARPGFSVFWDPAVRCPPIWGSGGAVDMLNQWVYAVPEPMNVAGPAEEILAMSAGRPGQQPAIMTQLICYRSQIAPTNKTVTPAPAWVKRRPLADFPSIPPDTLQEATWSMLAKPVQAVMYHGWGTIYETGAEKGYTYTNPETTTRITKLLKEVVAPLGPTLKNLGRATPPVAVLESFTTCALGGPASWGWKVPSVTFLQRARLDPRVVYEETILRDGLDGVKVLYAPQCIFLTPPVVAKIREFQSKGGILVADDQLLKALTADIQMPVVSFAAPPASDHTEDVDAMEAAREGDAKTRMGTMRAKAKMVAQAQELRRKLDGRYTPDADSSSPEIVVYSRRWNGARYVVAINDHRTFGDYVGPWGLTMEKGLPFEGEVTLADADGRVKAVYELSRGGEAAFSRADGRVKVPVKYDTNDGRLFAFLGERIASVKVDAPRSVRAGEAVRVTFSVLGVSGRPVEALLPAEIRLFDAAGRELDGAGWVCLKGGTCTVEIPTNLDDAPGGYRLVCTDRASGLSATRTISAAGR